MIIEPQKPAEFIMQIEQDSVAPDLKIEILSRLAQMISITSSRLIERTSDCAQTQDALFYNAANTTYFHVYLLPDPTNENNYNTPLLLVNNLNSRTTEIQQFIPRLADGDLLQMDELDEDIPTFIVRPSFTTSLYTYISISVSLLL